jgi:hypothetical protein
VVPQGKSLLLSEPPAGQKKAGYVMLTPKTIDDVKSWIGVPNSVGQRRKFPSPSAADLAVLSVRTPLTDGRVQSLQNLAYQYVYGDSTVLTQHSAAISQILQIVAAKASISGFTGIYLFQDVDVLENAELKLAANLKVFFADNIRIWKGGRITLLGNIKIDCSSIVGDYTGPKLPDIVEASLNLGVISNFVV